MNTNSILVALLCLLGFQSYSQTLWSPTVPAAAGNKIKLNYVINGAAAPGAPPAPPIFQLMTTDNTFATPQLTYHYTILDNGSIGFGVSQPLAKFHVGYLAYFSDRVGIGVAVPTEKFHLKDGNFLLSNGSAPVFKLTAASELTLTNPVKNSAFKVDLNGNVNVSNGDIIVSDLNEIQFRVYKDGLVRAREIRVNMSGIAPDYVFENTYSLMPMSELKKYIEINKHLPNVPSAKEMESTGTLDLSVMQFTLLEKVEELTLYMLQLKAENDALKARVCALEQ